MLLARTNPNVPKHHGITWMLIDMRQPGVEVRPLVQMNGSAEFCEVFLTEARVPVVNVIGDVDDGWKVARTTLGFERSSIGTSPPRGLLHAVPGHTSAMLDQPLRHVLETVTASTNGDRSRRFDVMIGSKSMIRLAREMGRADDPVVRQRVTDYYIRSEVHRLTGVRSRENAKDGRLGPESSILKLSTALLAHQSRDVSLSILGAEGMVTDGDARDGGRVQRAALSAHAPSFGGGTNEIQRNLIGERSLGLPREMNESDDLPFHQLRRS